MENLAINNPLKNYQFEKWTVESCTDVDFADIYLHPRETNFDHLMVWQVLEQSNLEFFCLSKPKIWTLDRITFRKGEKLASQTQIELIDLLDLDIQSF